MEFHTFPRIHCHPNHHQQHYQLSVGVGEGEKFVENSKTFEGAVDGGCGGGELLHLCGLLTNGGWMEMAALLNDCWCRWLNCVGWKPKTLTRQCFGKYKKCIHCRLTLSPWLFFVYQFPFTHIIGISKRFAIAATLNSISVCISLTFAFIIRRECLPVDCSCDACTPYTREGYTGRSVSPFVPFRLTQLGSQRLMRHSLGQGYSHQPEMKPLKEMSSGLLKYWRGREGNISPPTTLKTYINRLVMNSLAPGPRINDYYFIRTLNGISINDN